MAPVRLFSIPRATARHRLKMPRRFVSRTSSHSTSVIRTISVSRVMPALLTRGGRGPGAAPPPPPPARGPPPPPPGAGAGGGGGAPADLAGERLGRLAVGPVVDG